MPQKKACENRNFADGMPGPAWQFDDRGVADLIRLFADDLLRVFIVAQARQAGMSQVPVRRPFLKFNFAQRAAALATGIFAFHYG